MKKALLKALAETGKILDGIPWWLSGGQVLGAVREKGFLKNEHDIDLGVYEEDLPRIKKALGEKFEVVNSLEAHPRKAVFRKIDGTNLVRVIKFKIGKVGVDLFVMMERRGRRYSVTCDTDYGHAWHSYPKSMFERLSTIKLYGKKYKAPYKPEDYLRLEYGNWKLRLKEWNCCLDPPCIAKKVYVGGTFDLFHYGHLRLLKRAREHGEILYVSVMTDSGASSWKRKPIMSYEERAEIIKEFADVVLPQHDVDEVKDGFIESINPDVIIHGDDYEPFSSDWARENRKSVILLPYTKGISTSDIIRRVGRRALVDLLKEGA